MRLRHDNVGLSGIEPSRWILRERMPEVVIDVFLSCNANAVYVSLTFQVEMGWDFQSSPTTAGGQQARAETDGGTRPRGYSLHGIPSPTNMLSPSPGVCGAPIGNLCHSCVKPIGLVTTF